MKIINYSYDWSLGQDSTMTIDFEIDDNDPNYGDGKSKHKILRFTTIGHTTVQELD